ncbi:hypothetical protein [Marinomonas aquiplantarum]|uniref:Uncharacterized protein n=1 Tax=Marinomonas aquiplantarum TaxID=491951 RepID=A0A366D060_9GAMM|nr:hypothetical protein [Marinomonas aquiplantarum]RBO82658.1 hypothetical protein DFP76_105125 [Marinomonas aquiplantarum]
MDKHDSEDTESVESKKRHQLHKEFLKKTGSYFINYVYIVLFLEKEPKHPLVKFCAAITLLIVICLGVWQVIEARKSNEIASKTLELTNKVSAYSILADPNTRSDIYSEAFNIVSSYRNDMNLDISNRSLGGRYSLNLEGGESLLNIFNSSLKFNIEDVSSSFITSYKSKIKIGNNNNNFSGYLLNDTELQLIGVCGYNQDFKDHLYPAKNCNNYNIDYFDFSYINDSNVAINYIKNSIVDIQSGSAFCESEKLSTLKLCVKKSVNSISFNNRDEHANYNFTVSFGNNLIIRSNVLNKPEFERFRYRIISSNKIVFFNENNNYEFYAYKSKVVYNSFQIDEAEIIIDDSVFTLKGTSSNFLSKVMGIDYFLHSVTNCIYMKKEIYSRYMRRYDVSQDRFRCDYLYYRDFDLNDLRIDDYIDRVINKKYDGVINLDDFSKELAEVVLDQARAFDLKDKKIKSIINSKISIFNASEFLAQNYYFKGTTIRLRSHFLKFDVVNSIFDDNSFIEFEFHLDKEDPDLFCKKINLLFSNKEKFKGTNLKRSNIKIIPEEACTLDEGLFQ